MIEYESPFGRSKALNLVIMYQHSSLKALFGGQKLIESSLRTELRRESVLKRKEEDTECVSADDRCVDGCTEQLSLGGDRCTVQTIHLISFLPLLFDRLTPLVYE